MNKNERHGSVNLCLAKMSVCEEQRMIVDRVTQTDVHDTNKSEYKKIVARNNEK